MTVALPTPDQLRAVADQCGLALTDEDVTSFRGLMQGSVDAYNAVGAMPDEVPIVKYPRTPGYRPGPEENPRNAWYRKATVKGAASGKLKGKVVALKDNIMLAGVPMMNGSATLEGYVPDFDATIVTRMLDAGAEIAGKVHCESFCISGGSHTNSTGPVHNPHKMGFSAGGSSSGSAVVVALGEVDMAIGGDQGGSIRMPSSFSGTYGMKPTWGLVPTTGSMPISYSVDHCGPMGASVEDVARLLTVIAGHDGWDTRTIAARTGDYMGALGKPAKGLRVGILREGFGHPESDPAVTVRAVFVIDPAKKVRLILTYPPSTGRNFAEILRAIDSLQLTDARGIATPVNWERGEPVVISPKMSDEEAARQFPQGYRTLKPYLRIVDLQSPLQ